jgi:2-oxopent-4-enoate/cis-2-oxohex-4-enoate hydratase
VVDPLTTRYPDITIENAYHIQQRMLSRRLQAGERVVGKKIGVTSAAVMNMLGVYQPDFGYLLDGMIYNEGQSIDTRTLIQPKAEGEIAFILKKDLMGPGISNADVLAATECVMPCFEIVDSRIRDWKIKIQDTVADNASCGVFVLGDCAVDPRRVDLSVCGMVFEKNGDIIGTGAGAAALGSPWGAWALASKPAKSSSRGRLPPCTRPRPEITFASPSVAWAAARCALFELHRLTICAALHGQ